MSPVFVQNVGEDGPLSQSLHNIIGYLIWHRLSDCHTCFCEFKFQFFSRPGMWRSKEYEPEPIDVSFAKSRYKGNLRCIFYTCILRVIMSVDESLQVLISVNFQ